MSHYIKTLALGTMGNLIHLIIDKATQQAFVIDPGWDCDAILETLDHQQAALSGILLTHSHTDHVSAVNDLLAVQEVPVYLSRNEFRLGKVRLKQPCFLTDEQLLVLGETSVQVIATAGHTTGSVCYYVGDDLITGDTLFIDGCGRCNFLESDVEKMWESLQRLKELPDNTMIYPGHHYGQHPSDTLGRQKQTNPYLLIDDKDFFVEFRMDLQAQYRSIPFTPSSAQEIANIQQKHQ